MSLHLPIMLNLTRLKVNALLSLRRKTGSPELYMNDIKLDNVQLVKHLGHIITSDLTDDI